MIKCTCICKTATLVLSECANGFWLWDETRRMNLSMRANSERDAFLETIRYYQNRLIELETSHTALKLKVDNFVAGFMDKDDD